jgi:hypothetical protein
MPFARARDLISDEQCPVAGHLGRKDAVSGRPLSAGTEQVQAGPERHVEIAEMSHLIGAWQRCSAPNRLLHRA